jgi:hypothetical protein
MYIGQQGEKVNYMYAESDAPSDKCKRTLDFHACTKEKSTVEYIQFLAKILEWKDEYLEAWKGSGIEALLTPSTGMDTLYISSMGISIFMT